MDYKPKAGCPCRKQIDAGENYGVEYLKYAR